MSGQTVEIDSGHSKTPCRLDDLISYHLNTTKFGDLDTVKPWRHYLLFILTTISYE